MMTTVQRIDADERRARLGVRHRLARRADTVEAAADALVGLHSSDPSTVFLSARARVEGFEPPQLEHALYEQRSVVRLLGMRRTLFVVPTGVAGVIDAACTKALADGQWRRLAGMVAGQGVAEDAGPWLDDVCRRTLDALGARGAATARELTADVPELATTLSFGEGTSWASTTGMSTRVLFLLATRGQIVRARPLGGWTSGQYRWALTDTWLRGGFPEMAHDEACADLLRRYLVSFGPATTIDIRWWTGWTARLTASTLQRIGAVQAEVDGGRAWVRADDLEAGGPEAPWVALLPSLDATVMGWKERGWYLGDHAAELFDRNGNAGPTIWADGRVVGGWAQSADGAVRTRLLRRSTAHWGTPSRRSDAASRTGSATCASDRASARRSSGRSPRDSDRAASASAPMLGAMTCAVCGRPLPDDARFCPGCGAAVDELARHRRTQDRHRALRRPRRLHRRSRSASTPSVRARCSGGSTTPPPRSCSTFAAVRRSSSATR